MAPQWVRRTLLCERVEDCQTECGHEKRFTCEGFNYRLDASGRGQGICELIEVPLTQMDIYSSASRRDENLLYHPDYDYYERDRNACRPSLCKDCGSSESSGGKPYLPEGPPVYSSGSKPYYPESPPVFSSGKPYLPAPPPPEYNQRPTTYRPIENYKPYPEHRPPISHGSGGYDSSSDHFRPYDTAIDKYRPPPSYDSHHSSVYEHRPPPPQPPPSYEHHRPPPPPASYEYDRFDISYRPPQPSYELDRYDIVKPVDRPDYSEISIYNEHHYGRPNQFSPSYHDDRPHPTGEYLGPYKPPYEPSHSTFGYRPRKPDRFPGSAPVHNYLDREREVPPYRKPSKPFIPYTIHRENNSWASYGGSYGGSYNHQSTDYWGLPKDIHRNDQNFNYFNLGGSKFNPNENSVYPGSQYDTEKHHHHHHQSHPPEDKDRNYYGSLWTRRPGPDGKAKMSFAPENRKIQFIWCLFFPFFFKFSRMFCQIWRRFSIAQRCGEIHLQCSDRDRM